jgi:hypothetical protein
MIVTPPVNENVFTPEKKMIRVLQWTTGNVGQRAALAVMANPGLELVGCYAWSPDKAGRDIGDLIGSDPIGIPASDDVDALLGLKPDCVVYTPKFLRVDELVRILEAGVNVVATAGFITGHALGETERSRIQAACRRGASSIFGTGANPGFLNLLGLVSAVPCDRVDRISVTESVDSTGYDSPETEMPCGFGRPIDDPELPAMARAGTAVFEDGVRMMADALGIAIDEVRFDADFARTTADLDLGSWSIGAGCVAGVATNWQGRRNGATVLELKTVWRKGRTLDPDWPVEHAYLVEVKGQPCIRTRLQFLPGEDFKATTFKEYMVLGMIATAMPAVNAIPAVVAAPPGIVTYADLPLTTARGMVSPQ